MRSANEAVDRDAIARSFLLPVDLPVEQAVQGA